MAFVNAFKSKYLFKIYKKLHLINFLNLSVNCTLVFCQIFQSPLTHIYY